MILIIFLYKLKDDFFGFCFKVGKFIQQVTAFIGGFAIAVIKGWLLTLMMLSSIPAIVASAVIWSTVV